jgi:hypothetical protein
MPTIPKILATTALCLAAVGLSSCCFEQPLTCNLRELVTPPDARVAMVDHHFPHRPAESSDGFKVRYETGSKACSFEPYLYQLNGIYYQRRTIQYAKAHRPIIRRADRADSYPLTHQQYEEQFTFDTSIPEVVWMQPVDVTGEEREYNKLSCIPADRFDFANARKVAENSLSTCIPLCDLPLKDKPGTSSIWRTVAAAPLAVVDMAATATLCVAEGTADICTSVIVLPAYPFILFGQQQQRQQQPSHIEDVDFSALK